MNSVLLALIAYVTLICAIVIGWCMNVWDVVQVALAPAADFTVLLGLKVLGILVFPLGALLGYVS